MFINFNLMARRRDGHDAFPGVCREKTAVHRDSKAYIYLNRTKTTFHTNRSIIFLKLYRIRSRWPSVENESANAKMFRNTPDVFVKRVYDI